MFTQSLQLLSNSECMGSHPHNTLQQKEPSLQTLILRITKSSPQHHPTRKKDSLRFNRAKVENSDKPRTTNTQAPPPFASLVLNKILNHIQRNKHALSFLAQKGLPLLRIQLSPFLLDQTLPRHKPHIPRGPEKTTQGLPPLP